MRASGVCAANVPDGQAMWETSNSLWSAVQAGANMIYHAAGWLEGGLIASPEKFVMDCEILQHIQRYLDPVLTRAGPEDIATEAVREVGGQGPFLRHSAHAGPLYHRVLRAVPERLAQLRGVGGGGRHLDLRARPPGVPGPDIIAGFEAPKMDDGIREELAAFVERRKAEGGAPTDF